MNKREDEEPGFIGQVIGCLTSPRTSFKSILEKPSLLKAATLILVIAIVASWASYNYAGKLPLPSVIERETRRRFLGPGGFVSPEQLQQTLVILNTVTGFIGVFGGWLISSAIVHALSRARGRRGTFKSMLTLAGYASMPLLIQHVLRLIDSFVITEQGLLQLSGTTRVFNQPLLNAITNAAINVFSVFRLWSVALLVIALCENYEISTARSVVTVAATYIIILFLSMFLPL
ncbi:MAG: Yip1 family protein [Candidatus Bathyarchaeia archaeon]